MKTKTKILIGLGTIAATVGAVLATPIVGLTSPFLAVGQSDSDQSAQGKGISVSGVPFHVSVDADGPSTSSIQDFSLLPGGHNGWHSHPGMVVVVLLSGSITWYDHNCNAIDYKAGDAWMEGDQIHAFKVTSTTPLHAMAYFLTAQGVPARTDQPAPKCAEKLGL